MRIHAHTLVRHASRGARARARARARALSATPTPVPPSPRGRVPPSIWSKTTARLHLQRDHPLCTLRAHIEHHLSLAHPNTFTFHNELSPVVTAAQCFDDLLVPADHPSRAASDTYYIDDTRLLRAHMTAHDVALLRAGARAFVACGDVYRRDTVDRTHYPVFHQVDAARLFPAGTPPTHVEADLKATVGGLARALFGGDVRTRWVHAYFPFTMPSFEVEVEWGGEWLEVLGCGLLQRDVLRKAEVADEVCGWAFGLGLERLAMVLFKVPDIRLFWSQDERFLGQFRGKGVEARFKAYSVFPGVEKDVSFWVEDEARFHENDVHEAARAVCGDLVENVAVIDRFRKEGKTSLCFRVRYRSMERNLTHVEVNDLDAMMRKRIAASMPVTLR